ncbi:uncharacterized protein PRCAT00004949001 [Priceomyces carsonii]|uniref:uncharacterized protein n=1 Tax=Priceomyces carsonii TaxID=28549 RepID=UPI002ED95194|nr:unnamed protein product [Priceomyces carsonii]
MVKVLCTEFENMACALFLAFKALMNKETPVSCVFVSKSTNKVISVGYNGTNDSLNGTRHAELIAIDYILENYIPTDYQGDIEYIKQYFLDIVLYVTVEPCIMCASALRQIGISKVIFGCGNDRFGGNGTVLSINRDPALDAPYQSIGGILRTEAIMLLRNFYIQENESAPIPKIKKNKDLEGKEYPENIKFRNYITKEEFIDTFGLERLKIWESEAFEITPIPNKGYSVKDITSREKLRKSLGEFIEDFEDFNSFLQLFYDVSDNGQVSYDKKVITVEDYGTKKRKRV